MPTLDQLFEAARRKTQELDEKFKLSDKLEGGVKAASDAARKGVEAVSDAVVSKNPGARRTAGVDGAQSNTLRAIWSRFVGRDFAKRK